MSSISIDRKISSFPLSTAFVDNYMCRADATFVKVYLYALRESYRSDSSLSVETAAKALGILESDVIRAFTYWDSVGVLRFLAQGTGYTLEFLEPAAGTTPKSAKAAAPKRPRYSTREISACMQADGGIRNMYELAQKILGKPLTSTDVTTLYSLYDWLKLPKEVILMLLEHCASLGKTNMRYIEKVAISWADQGIDTLGAAQAYLREYAEKKEQSAALKKILQIHDRDFTDAERKYIEEWVEVYHATPEAIKEAYEVTVLNTGKRSFPYMNSVLKAKAEGRQKGAANAPRKKGFANYSEKSDMSDFEKDMLKKRMNGYTANTKQG